MNAKNPNASGDYSTTTSRAAANRGLAKPTAVQRNENPEAEHGWEERGNAGTRAAALSADSQVASQGVQAKLTVGAPGDEYEREADQVANQVMRMGDDEVRTLGAPPSIQRLCPECEEELRSMPAPESAENVGDVPPIVHGVLSSPGQPLDAGARGFFEPRFGRDFQDVRVHTGADAAESARAIHARAYTAGRNVVFRAGEYAPGSLSGQALLAHELTHVIQQGGGQSPAPPPGSEGHVQRREVCDELGGNCQSVPDEEPGGRSYTPATKTAPSETRPPAAPQKPAEPSEWCVPGTQKPIEGGREVCNAQGLWQSVPNAEKATPTEAGAKAGKAVAPASGFRSVDVSKLDGIALEQEYQMVQQRLIARESYPERPSDEAYLETIEAEIRKRESLKNTPKPASPSAEKATENNIFLDYDDFSLPDGHPKSIQAQASIMFDWQKLEQVYSDAKQGNKRAKLFWQYLEDDTNVAGINIANELYSDPCQVVPAMQCVIHLERYDFLRKDKPGALRLRGVLYGAFEKKAREIGLTVNLIVAVANALLASTVVAGALSREMGAVATEAAGEAKALAGEGKVAGEEAKAASGEAKAGVGEAKATSAEEGKVSAVKAAGEGKALASGGQDFTVVELGAGDLKASIQLAKKGGAKVKVVAVDPAAPPAAAMQELQSAGGTFIRGTAESLPPGMADHVFQYLPWRIGESGSLVIGGTWRLVEDTIRLFKPGGAAHFVTEDFTTAEFLAKEASRHGLKSTLIETTAGAAAPGASGAGVPNFTGATKVWLVNVYQ